MNRLLLFLHLLLCTMAIVFGAVTIFDLLTGHLRTSRLIRFLRLSLGSNLAALFLSMHILFPAQKVAIAAVYTTGLVVLAWRVFQLGGAWRKAFAFALAIVLYLNILALSVWVPGFATNIWWYSQATLIAAALGLGILAARTFSDGTTLLPSTSRHAARRG